MEDGVGPRVAADNMGCLADSPESRRLATLTVRVPSFRPRHEDWACNECPPSAYRTSGRCPSSPNRVLREDLEPLAALVPRDRACNSAVLQIGHRPPFSVKEDWHRILDSDANHPETQTGVVERLDVRSQGHRAEPARNPAGTPGVFETSPPRPRISAHQFRRVDVRPLPHSCRGNSLAGASSSERDRYAPTTMYAASTPGILSAAASLNRSQMVSPTSSNLSSATSQGASDRSTWRSSPRGRGLQSCSILLVRAPTSDSGTPSSINPATTASSRSLSRGHLLGCPNRVRRGNSRPALFRTALTMSRSASVNAAFWPLGSYLARRTQRSAGLQPPLRSLRAPGPPRIPNAAEGVASTRGRTSRSVRRQARLVRCRSPNADPGECARGAPRPSSKNPE